MLKNSRDQIFGSYLLIMACVFADLFHYAHAQESTEKNPEKVKDIFDLTLREIVNMRITATKQDDATLQDVPGTIKVITGKELQTLDFTSLPDYASHETGMGFSRFGSLPSYYMRSIGSDQQSLAIDSSVALHSDGVYLGMPEMASTLFFDINRIESLYGPQGMLYGRNATAGAIDIISNKPELDKSFQTITATVGSFDRRDASYVLNAPLNDEQAVRLALIAGNNDGYIEDQDSQGSNQSDDQRAQGIRGQWLYQIRQNFQIIFGADWFDNHQNGIASIPLDQQGAAYPYAQSTDDFFSIRNNQNTHDDLHTGGWNGTASWQVNQVTWTNILAWRTARHDYFLNTDGTEIDISGSDLDRKMDQWSDEIRANWGNRESSGAWLVGANAYKANADLDFGLIKYPLNQTIGANTTFVTHSNLDTQAWSVFGEHEHEIIDEWFLKLGLRYSVEEKQNNVEAWQNPDLNGISTILPNATFIGRSDDSDRWNDLMPQLVLQHNFSPDWFSYASITKGFKSGGMNSFSVTDKPVDPENVISYEVGARYTDEANRLLFNTAIYHYDYDDLQVATIVNSLPVLSNAAKASIDGIGVGAIKEISQWQLSSNVTYRRATYDNYLAARAGVPSGVDVSGNTLPQTPRWQINNQASYSFTNFSIPVTALVRWEFRDKIYFNPYEESQASQGAINLWFAHIDWELTEDMEVSLFGDNLTNVEYFENIVWNSSTRAAAYPEGNLLGYPAPGRTFGASINWRFE